MNRIYVLVLSAMVAVAGCAHDNKDDASASAEKKYKILNGSTSDSDKEIQDAPEPALNADTHFAAGLLAESQHKYDCAMIQYEQAIRLQADHIPSLYRLGVVSTKNKDYDKAIATWNQYIKVTGKIAAGYSNLGFCYEMAGDIDNAQAAYKKGIERDPKSIPCRTNYGLMLARQNRVDEAQVQLAAVLPPAQVSYNLATVYEQQGEIARAKEELLKALAANPKMVEAQTRLANLPTD